MTALVDTLFQLEKYLGLELDSLLPFAQADDVGGFHPNRELAKWDVGAIWDVEGKTLHALIRALKPQTVVEIGSGKGCSTTHIVTALALNGSGHLTTIDRGNTPRVPDGLEDWVEIRNGDALEWLEAQSDGSIDFILEDADHSEALCYAIGELAKRKLAPGGVLLAHDAEHPTVGRDVRAGYDRAGLDFRRYLTEPSDCGWACWQRPDVKADYSPFAKTELLPEGGVELSVDIARVTEMYAGTLQADGDEPPPDDNELISGVSGKVYIPNEDGSMREVDTTVSPPAPKKPRKPRTKKAK